jgi:glycosyltransferase involved in cell wall biosynthesis/2-polyprenyl-3-methyl-5-hydroxy-6-metoxy-1,4-benzoquinol methylase
MDRNDRIRQSFSKEMRLIEIGAGYNPIAPKRDGWDIKVVDHGPRTELIEKYRDHPTVDAIEEVDVIWRDGPLADAFPVSEHGGYDGLIASHVLEHMPDLVGFLRSVDVLLKRSGIFFLALPDKRLCFDFFHPSTTTGNVVDGMGKSRHSRGALFNHAAYYAHRNGEGAWFVGGQGGEFTLVHKLEATREILGYDELDYRDSHAWYFTPASFELLILELNALGLVPWRVARVEPQAGVEFFVWLERGETAKNIIEPRRAELLKQTIVETKSQVMDIEPAPRKPSQPTIAAIIPLYNGARFIRESLESILAQTMLPDEIIVVDDGSGDDGGQTVKQIIQEQQDGPPIKLLRKDNGGQSCARNLGVQHSTSDLIALLDQDDAWYPQHLEKLIEPFLKSAPVGKELGWVYSDLDEYDGEDGVVHRSYIKTRKLGVEHPKLGLFPCLQDNMYVLPSASLILRKAFDEVGGFDERLSGYEDDDLFLRMFRAGYGNVFLDIALSKWRIYHESSSYTYRMRRSRAIYLRKLLAAYPDDPRSSRFLTRDLIAPRFYRDALGEFVRAVRDDKDKALIEETRDELLFILSYMPGLKKRLLRQAVTMMRSPKTLRMVRSIRPYARPLARLLV